MRIVVTGMGVISPLGHTRQAFARAWADGRAGVGELTLAAPENGCEHAAEVVDYDWRAALVSQQSFADRASQLTVGAVRGALLDAGWPVPYAPPAGSAPGGASPGRPADDPAKAPVETVAEEPAPLGLCLGTCYGCVEAAERFYAPVAAGKGRGASALVFSHSYPNGPAAMASIEFGLRGYGAVYAGSREAGLWALRGAVDALRQGGRAGVTRILAGAVDAISGPVLGHLAATGQSPSTAGRAAPEFVDAASEAEAGIWGRVPGEGALFFALETEASASARGARVLAEWNDAEALAELSSSDAPDAARGGWRLGDAGAVTALYALAARWLGKRSEAVTGEE